MQPQFHITLKPSPVRVGIKNVADYSPFGVQLNGRTFSTTEYRIGFQNQEKDDEIKGEGNSVNYTYRMHDPRVGRFFAVDPLAGSYPHNGSYNFSENRVIDGVELEGLEVELVNSEGKTEYGPLSSEYIDDQISKGGHLLTRPKIEGPDQEEFNPNQLYGTQFLTQVKVSYNKKKDGVNNGASNANNSLDKAVVGTESALNLKDVDAPNTRSFLKGAGLATTIIEGVTIVENAVETGDYTQAGVEVVTAGFETMVIDRMIITPNPYTIGAGVAYYVIKAMFIPCPECGPAPLPENWNQLKDQDNTRTGGIGGGF